MNFLNSSLRCFSALSNPLHEAKGWMHPDLRILCVPAALGILLLAHTSGQGATLPELTVPGPARDAMQARHEASLKRNPKNLIALRELGIIEHMRVVEGKETEPKLITSAYELLKKAYLQDKTHPLTMAYYGSITTMMALTTERQMSKLKHVKSGTRKLDKAVRLVPDDVNVRMVRGNNSLGLPKFLKRSRLAVKDFLHVLKLLPSASAEFQAELHYKISRGYSLMDDEKQAEIHRKKAAQIAPDSDFVKMAQSN